MDTVVFVTIDELENALSEKKKISKEISNMEYSIENKKNLIKELDMKISKLCDHNFVNDYIDTMFPYRESILITYCEYCELSKDVVDSNK
jgi:hypothetical protein